jgi:hypothetical protein
MIMKDGTWDRLVALSKHPHTGSTPQAMADLCVSEGISFEGYADALELQLGVLDVVLKYGRSRMADGANQFDVLTSAAASCASAIAASTRDNPLPGSDVAATIVNGVVEVFTSFLSNRISWTQPVWVKTPTNDISHSTN